MTLDNGRIFAKISKKPKIHKIAQKRANGACGALS